MQKHLTVKELPKNERPYEKCMYYGPEALTDAELLAIFLRTGTRHQTAMELGALILGGGNRNLMNLYDYGIQELMKFQGIGKVKAIQLKCIAEIWISAFPRRSLSLIFIWKSCGTNPSSILSSVCWTANAVIWESGR